MSETGSNPQDADLDWLLREKSAGRWHAMHNLDSNIVSHLRSALQAGWKIPDDKPAKDKEIFLRGLELAKGFPDDGKVTIDQINEIIQFAKNIDWTDFEQLEKLGKFIQKTIAQD